MPAPPSSFIPHPSSLLEVRGLHAGYGPVEVLQGVDLAVRDGEIVTVLGANGAGKTTLLMCVSGIIPGRRGTIEFGGAPIHQLRPEAIVARGISQVPEGRLIFSRLTVRENLEMGAFQRENGDELAADLGRVFTLFPLLEERQRQLGGTLSGGEQQMLAISRALMARPRLLLLDEPSLGLSPLLVARIFAMISEINRTGTTILLVEQNANLALQVAHRGYVLQTGQIVLADTAANLRNNEQVQKSYLGG